MKLTKGLCLIFVIVLLCSLVGGCMHFVIRTEPAPVRVVTHIDITYENGTIQTQRHYEDAGKMKQVLNYLRLIDPYGRPAVDPEIVGGSHFHIELAYSDGSSKVSLRSTKDVSSSDICAVFGGGGHAMAAGCTIFGEPEKARDMLLNVIEEVWK